MDRYRFDRFLLGMVPQSVNRIEGRCISISREDKYFLLEIKDREQIPVKIKAKNIVGSGRTDAKKRENGGAGSAENAAQKI